MKVKDQLSSNFFFAPINTGFVEKNQPSARLVEFHRERSGEEIGISYVGNVAISEDFKTNPNTLVLAKNTLHWKRLVDAIQMNSSKSGIQLACRKFSSAPRRSWSLSKKENLVAEYQRFITSLSSSQVMSVMDEFVRAAEISLEIGFDVIQIHAAHGYFLSLLLTRSINLREDEFGIANCGGILDLLDRLRALDSDYLLDIRLSCFEGILAEREREWESKKIDISKMAKSPVDMISLSAGFYDISKTLIYPSIRQGHALYFEYGYEVAQIHSSKLFNVSGNIWNISEIPKYTENMTFGIGRPLLADPKFLRKSMDGRAQEINVCQRTGKCHYFTRGESEISCGVNSSI